MNLVLHGGHQQAIHGVNITSDTKSFDLPFSALLGPLEIAEVYHSNYDVGTPFGISNREEVDISVAQGRWQVVIPDILRNITLEIIKCFAAFFGKLRILPLPLLSLEIFQRGSDRVRRHQDAGSGSSEGTAEQDKRHLDELAPERR
jgi:hypothetical protein